MSFQATVATRRLAGAPISWGVCEVPGWGGQMEPDRVLAEMASLGLTATELGPTGYLGTTPAEIRARLDRHGLTLVGGFVPVVLHEDDGGVGLEHARPIARMLADAGADAFVATVVLDQGWSEPRPLDRDEWRRVIERLAELDALAGAEGLTLALHPHAGTLIQTAQEVERVITASQVGWCLDTGHLLIGGSDPVAFVRDHGSRIVHAHLKDVDAHVASRLRTGELDLVQAVQAGLFRPLGRGDARIAEVVRGLDDHGYDGWLVLEQDTAIAGEEPPAGRGPIDDVRLGIAHLATLAPQEEESTP